MAMLVVIGYLKVPFWQLVIAQRREFLQLAIQAPAVALNILLNLVLIRRYGGFGAVAASLVSGSLMLLGFSVSILRQSPLNLAKIAVWMGAALLACIVGLGLRLVTEPLVAAMVGGILLAAAFYGLHVVRIGGTPVLRRFVKPGQSGRQEEPGPGNGAGP